MLYESQSEMLLGTLERLDTLKEEQTSAPLNLMQQIADKITANEVVNGEERNIQ